MSIQDAIKGHDESELFSVRTSWEGEETPRFAYVSREVATFLWEPDVSEKRLAKRSSSLIDDFVEGGYITIGWEPHGKGAKCIMARVDSPDPDYCVWDVRCLDPKPGVRILGGFAGKDVFLGLTWDYRENFDDAWTQQIEHCIDEWKRLFGKCLPLKASNADEYLSQPFKVV